MNTTSDSDPGARTPSSPLNRHEAQLSALLVGIAVLLTFVSVLTYLMAPFAVMAWLVVWFFVLLRHYRLGKTARRR